MSRCPFAIWKPIGRSPGPYRGGPFRLVHHTTEGSTAEGAFAAYRRAGVTPHATIDRRTIFQHHDTAVSASAVLNKPGGCQTNRLSAIQIEVVGFAGKPKERETLENVARFCRWAEETHGIPRVWPAGPPRYGTSDPGGHNRSVRLWTTQGGHYGHSQVPENTHWDPAYRPEELEIVMGGVSLDREPIAVGIVIPDAGGYIDADGTSWAWVRPVAEATETRIVTADDKHCVLERPGYPAKTFAGDIYRHEDGKGYIPLREMDDLGLAAKYGTVVTLESAP